MYSLFTPGSSFPTTLLRQFASGQLPQPRTVLPLGQSSGQFPSGFFPIRAIFSLANSNLSGVESHLKSNCHGWKLLGHRLSGMGMVCGGTVHRGGGGVGEGRTCLVMRTHM